MKVAVYAICKNELQNVESFMRSACEADCVVVLDTGSTDGTWEALQKYKPTANTGKQVAVEIACIQPWRFDTARNAALAFVPHDTDLCVVCDMDERFPAGWRKTLETVWPKQATRMQVKYVFSWKEDGTPDIVFYMNRVHVRHGYEWHHPVHECLKWTGKGTEHAVNCDQLELHHFQNRKTSRAQYLPLLEMACQVTPSDDRNSHYLGREYWYAGRYDDCVKELTRHLALPSATWTPERAASMSYIARSLDAQKKYEQAESWYVKACAEYDCRDHWCRLAQFYLNRKMYAAGYGMVVRSLQHQTRPLHYLSDSACWGAWPYDIAAACAYYLGLKTECMHFYEKALELAPKDKRIRADFELCQSLLDWKVRVP